MSDIQIKKVESNKDLLNFIKLPWKIYKDDPNWVPPLIMDRKNLLNKKTNPFFQHAEMDMFLAYKNNEIVGRIAAITNENHNKFHEDNVGFFGFYESIEDDQVSNQLFDTVKSWLKERGKEGMLGPMNPSTNDEAGLLIDGFDIPPVIMMCHNPKYYINQFEQYGLTKAKDLYAWYLDVIKNEIPEKLRRLAKITTSRYGITLRNLKLKNLKEELKLVREVYNDAWTRNWGFVPFTPDEIEHVANDLKQIANEELLLIAEKDGRPIGFSVTIPNINEILIKIKNGKLLPSGIFKLLTGMKKLQTVRVVILGVIKEFQHAGLGSVFYLETIERVKKLGMIGGEMSWILEDNIPMNKAIEMLGSELYKKYRIFQLNF